MELTKIIDRAINIVTEQPMILVPCLAPFIVTLIASVAGIGWFVSSSEYFEQLGTLPLATMRPEEIFQELFSRLAPVLTLYLVSFFIALILGSVAFAMVVAMTAAKVEGKELTLSQAFSSISGKILLLIIASIVITLLTYLGFCAVCIGAFLVWVFLALVRQGIVIDGLGFGGSFSRSFNITKRNFLDTALILLLFLVLKFIIGLIPVIGGALGYVVDTFTVAAMTVFYLDRR